MWVYVCTLGPCVVPLSKIIAYIPAGAERIGTGSVLKSLFAICRKTFFFLNAFIGIVLVNTHVNSTLIEFSDSVVVCCNMLISSKVQKVMCKAG